MKYKRVVIYSYLYNPHIFHIFFFINLLNITATSYDRRNKFHSLDFDMSLTSASPQVSSIAAVDPFKTRDLALLRSFPYCESESLLKNST